MTQTLDRDSVVVAGPWGTGGPFGVTPGLVGIVAAGELLADPAAVEPSAKLSPAKPSLARSSLIRSSAVGLPGAESSGAGSSGAGSFAVEFSGVESPDVEAPVIGALDVEACILRFVPAAEEAARRSRPGRLAASGRRPVRLTRRGRLVVLAALIVLAGAIAAFAALPSQAADPATPPRVVVVQPGDSLWSIVERYRPGADPVRAVDELIRVNKLPGTTIYAGEELTLPSKW